MNPAATLARKYRALVELRHARAHTGETAARHTLLALARAYPGALRELDRTPLLLLEARRAACKRVLSGDDVEAPWMAWMCAYHEHLGVAFALKRAARAGGATPAEAAELAECVERLGGPTYARALLAPPGGRVVPVVLAQLASRFDVPRATLETALFGAPRPSR